MGLVDTCRRLLEDRGYSRIHPPKSAKQTGVLRDLLLEARAPGRSALVLDHSTASVGVEWARKLVALAATGAHDEFVLVVADGANATSYSARQLFANLNVTVFRACRLAVPYVDSIYVPPHRKSSESELAVSHPTVNPDSIPTISESDPVCLWYGWRPGTVIVVRLKFGNMTPYNMFERVVPAA